MTDDIASVVSDTQRRHDELTAMLANKRRVLAVLLEQIERDKAQTAEALDGLEHERRLASVLLQSMEN
jgi:hypothetical protein